MEEVKQQSATQTADVQGDKDLVGIKGWLILVAIGVVISPLRVFYESINIFKPIFTTDMWQRLTSQFGDMYHPLWEPLLIIEILFNVTLFFASLYLIVLFFKHKKAFVSWYLAILLGGLAFIVLDAFVVSLLVPSVTILDSEMKTMLIRGVIQALIWGPYMLLSQRVKATFVK
ncbi:DUF2569 domain-containing protein [Pseudoalteromonas lipolytica]|uniref:DUF2569 domain-containing protein n=1 Tax=Pseudoalteromonas lipolytica TaxID=570156 RepID=UPI00241F2A2E|nr:DUF2569 domain-containing protein [Pseudoalteromonas lipolytica]|tara:strand:- start:4784 stop:5302 length:519 start_codon:yes stop_codon:yes gene_type:complete